MRTSLGPCPGRRLSVPQLLALACSLCLLATLGSLPATAQNSYQRISGEGSSWAKPAIDAVKVNVKQFGITVDYAGTGSTSGRRNFLNGTVDFAASDIPFQFKPEDGSAPENPAPDSYAYIPVTAGGTAFIYNLKINGQRVTNLRLSGDNVAKIFTGSIEMWNDPALTADNPGLTLPARKIVPVVRSDGSGSTAQFTAWMIDRHGGIWDDYCQRSERAPACGETSFYPTIQGMIGQSGDEAIASYVSANYGEGAIGYVNYSHALNVQFPVAKVLNAAGFYTEPTPSNVAVSLLKARINQNAADPSVYLTQELDGVYNDPDPRSYQLSSYSYFILPTVVAGNFNEAKGRTLGAFAYYTMCQAQQQSASLGYSPLPINLVDASFDQIRKVPGVEVQSINIQSCNNPTFSPDGTNKLANEAPMPAECDRKGPSQCSEGTAGMASVPTATVSSVVAGTSGTASPSVAASSGGTVPPAGATNTGATTAATTPATGEVPAAALGNPEEVTGADQEFAGDPTIDDGSAQVPTGAGSGGLALGPTVTATLPSSGRAWPLTVLVVLLTIGVVVVPAIGWSRLTKTAGGAG